MPRHTAEQIYRGMLRGPLTTKAASASNQWAGRTTVSTDAAVGSVATTIVDSDSIILMTAFIPTAAASLGFGDVVVTSINPGVGFTFGWSGNTALAVEVPVMWVLFKTQ